MVQKIEAVWPQWKVVRRLGGGAFGQVFEVVRHKYGVEERSAVKVIPIPASRDELESLRHEGMSEQDTSTYYQGLVNEFAQEIALMSKLRRHNNIVGYEDFEVIERKDEFGWDIFIRMELLTSLPLYIESKTSDLNATVSVHTNVSAVPFGENDVIKMAIDLCTALEDCHKQHIVHRDIKPDNIFVSEDGTYKLGDFGVAKTVEKTISGLSKKGTPTYMAPEIYKGEPGGLNSDLYSLGIVLYKLLNNNREPFLPPYPQPISFADKQQALSRRISGETLPAPQNGSKALLAVVQKACAFSPRERYASATEMKRELRHILRQNTAKKMTADKKELSTQNTMPSPTVNVHNPLCQQPSKRSLTAGFVLSAAVGVKIFAIVTTLILTFIEYDLNKVFYSCDSPIESLPFQTVLLLLPEFLPEFLFILSFVCLYCYIFHTNFKKHTSLYPAALIIYAIAYLAMNYSYIWFDFDMLLYTICVFIPIISCIILSILFLKKATHPRIAIFFIILCFISQTILWILILQDYSWIFSFSLIDYDIYNYPVIHWSNLLTFIQNHIALFSEFINSLCFSLGLLLVTPAAIVRRKTTSTKND